MATTELSLMATPGRPHSFSPKDEFIPEVAEIPIHDPNTRFRPGYAPFTFPPKRFPPAYVKTR